eukprot:4536577-Amphidinium_carterae.1
MAASARVVTSSGHIKRKRAVPLQRSCLSALDAMSITQGAQRCKERQFSTTMGKRCARSWEQHAAQLTTMSSKRKSPLQRI